MLPVAWLRSDKTPPLQPLPHDAASAASAFHSLGGTSAMGPGGGTFCLLMPAALPALEAPPFSMCTPLTYVLLAAAAVAAMAVASAAGHLIFFSAKPPVQRCESEHLGNACGMLICVMNVSVERGLCFERLRPRA